MDGGRRARGMIALPGSGRIDAAWPDFAVTVRAAATRPRSSYSPSMMIGGAKRGLSGVPSG